MKSHAFASSLLCLITFAASAANPAPGSAPVNIVGPLPLPVTGSTTISGTVSVRDVDNPARQPFHLTLCNSTAAGGASLPSCFGSPNSVIVANGARLVIEYVSAECFASNVSSFRVSLRTSVGGTAATHYMHFNPDPLDARVFDHSQQTRIYADAGTTLGLGFSAGTVGADPSSLRCDVTLSGYSITP